jgi:GPI mannosyltransferase 3
LTRVRLDRRDWQALSAMLVLAFLLRLIHVFVLPSIHHPDEVFQSVEQAHRLVYGTGIVPWEFVYGIRSWLLPGLIAALLWTVKPISEQPIVYMAVLGVLGALASLAVPASVFLWARRHGRIAAVLAALLPAIWVDLIYFGSRMLSEVVATHVLVLGILAIDRADGRRGPAIAAGALLGLAFLLRFHLAFGIAAIVLWCCWRDRRLWLPVLGGGAAMLLCGGLLDALTWTYPWQSIWLNFVLNVAYGVSSEFSTEPWYWYLVGTTQLWSGGAVILFALAAIGARDRPLPTLAFVVILASHSLIPHKEYRFMYPAITLLIIAAGLGIARLASGIRPRAAWAIGATIGLAGVATVLNPVYREQLWTEGLGSVAASRWLRAQGDICGLAFGHAMVRIGGYTYLHDPIPLFDIRVPEQVAPQAAGFNAVLFKRGQPIKLDGYDEPVCFREICLARRTGGCAAIPPWQNTWRPDALQKVEPLPRRFGALPSAAARPE